LILAENDRNKNQKEKGSGFAGADQFGQTAKRCHAIIIRNNYSVK